MTFSLTKTLAAGALAAAFAAPASALTATGVLCSDGTTSPSFVSCSGAWEGNNLGNAAKLAEVQAQILADFGSSYSLVGSSDGAGSGPFISNPGGSSGTLTFDSAVTGSFVVALKAANEFSLYLFNGGSAGISSIDYSTLGVSVNRQGIPQGLSHATLYGGGTTPPVPEPETYALMLAGLGAVALITRRRRIK